MPVCAKCNEREGTLRFIEDPGNVSMAISHFPNSIPWWCKLCAVRAKLAYATQEASRIPELEQELKELELNDDE